MPVHRAHFPGSVGPGLPPRRDSFEDTVDERIPQARRRKQEQEQLQEDPRRQPQSQPQPEPHPRPLRGSAQSFSPAHGSSASSSHPHYVRADQQYSNPDGGFRGYGGYSSYGTAPLTHPTHQGHPRFPIQPPGGASYRLPTSTVPHPYAYRGHDAYNAAQHQLSTAPAPFPGSQAGAHYHLPYPHLPPGPGLSHARGSGSHGGPYQPPPSPTCLSYGFPPDNTYSTHFPPIFGVPQPSVRDPPNPHQQPTPRPPRPRPVHHTYQPARPFHQPSRSRLPAPAPSPPGLAARGQPDQSDWKKLHNKQRSEHGGQRRSHNATSSRDLDAPLHNFTTTESPAIRDYLRIPATTRPEDHIGSDDDDWQAFEADVVQGAPTPASIEAIRRDYTLVHRIGVAELEASEATLPIACSSVTANTPATDKEAKWSPLLETPASEPPSTASQSVSFVRDLPHSAGNSLSPASPAADNSVDSLRPGRLSAFVTEASLTANSCVGSFNCNRASEFAVQDLAYGLPVASPSAASAIDLAYESIRSPGIGATSGANIILDFTPSASSVVESTGKHQVDTTVTSVPSIDRSLSSGCLTDIVVSSDKMNQDKGKRKASEDFEAPAAVKRIKQNDSAEPEPKPKVPAIPFPEKPAVIEERNGEIQFRVVNNDNERESLIILTHLKCIFQKQLPKMPKDYIARLVYDRTHLSIAIVKHPLEVVGGITFRPFRDRKFAEIVFCAISSDQQVKGYGAHLMAHLKDYVKSTSPVMHFLTYADNYAIGYFKKQGFTKEITLEKSVWMGYIKDYEGGTIMQCSMLPRLRYLESGRMLLKQKECVQAKIRAISKSHVVHQPPKQWKSGVVPIDPMKIEAIKNSGWSAEMDELARQPRRGANYNQLLHLLNAMQNHQSAWPFLAPVNKDEVQDYYDVIKEPMDLATMETKLDMDQYPNPEDFIKDAMLIYKNCRQYNSEGTPYTKMANKLEKFMWTKIREIPEWSHYEEEYASKK